MRSVCLTAGLAAILALVPGCSKPVQDIVVATPAPETARPSAAPVEAVPAPAVAEPLAATASEVKLTMPVPTEDRPLNPAQLQGAYLAAKDKSDRIEIVYQLGHNDTADALNVLTRLFQSEADEHLKQEMLDAADRIDGHLPAMLTLLGLALGPSQPADVRDSALSMFWASMTAGRFPPGRRCSRLPIPISRRWRGSRSKISRNCRPIRRGTCTAIGGFLPPKRGVHPGCMGVAFVYSSPHTGRERSGSYQPIHAFTFDLRSPLSETRQYKPKNKPHENIHCLRRASRARPDGSLDHTRRQFQRV